MEGTVSSMTGLTDFCFLVTYSFPDLRFDFWTACFHSCSCPTRLRPSCLRGVSSIEGLDAVGPAAELEEQTSATSAMIASKYRHARVVPMTSQNGDT